jgi:hypothetical protein
MLHHTAGMQRRCRPPRRATHLLQCCTNSCMVRNTLLSQPGCWHTYSGAAFQAEPRSLLQVPHVWRLSGAARCQRRSARKPAAQRGTRHEHPADPHGDLLLL